MIASIFWKVTCGRLVLNPLPTLSAVEKDSGYYCGLLPDCPRFWSQLHHHIPVVWLCVTEPPFFLGSVYRMGIQYFFLIGGLWGIKPMNIFREFRTLVLKVCSVDQQLLHPPGSSWEMQNFRPCPWRTESASACWQDPQGVHVHTRSTGRNSTWSVVSAL